MPSAMENLLGWGLFLLVLLAQGVSSYDYGEALSKSLLYFEAQRSGKLPDNQRVTWRADSGLKDGQDATVDLTGGYYDSGDNVKFGFPLAFTATMLSWSATEFEDRLQAKNELSNALQAVKWATDYIIKSHPEPNVLYGEVGEGHSDHDCWQRPEDMTTPRTPFKIDEQNPGSDLAAESAAALAAASIAFKKSDASYSTTLITHAKQLFDFACNHTGKYQDSIKEATEFYSSSGFQDELVWAAAWLFRATHEQPYLEYVASVDDVGGTRTTFSWDDKYVGAQVLVAKLVLGSEVPEDGNWVNYKNHAEEFICSVIQKHNNNVKKTGGGLLWWDQPWNALQYTTTATFVTLAYSDYLANADAVLKCQSGEVSPADLITFAKTQVDYILGSNPSNMSYMVGFGTKYPEKVHHRGASIVSIKKDPTPVTCKGGYESYFNRDAPNVNVLTGAIVGGPNDQDSYEDSRSNFQQAEPATVNTAPFVGVLARLAE